MKWTSKSDILELLKSLHENHIISMHSHHDITHHEDHRLINAIVLYAFKPRTRDNSHCRRHLTKYYNYSLCTYYYLFTLLIGIFACCHRVAESHIHITYHKISVFFRLFKNSIFSVNSLYYQMGNDTI